MKRHLYQSCIFRCSRNFKTIPKEEIAEEMKFDNILLGFVFTNINLSECFYILCKSSNLTLTMSLTSSMQIYVKQIESLENCRYTTKDDFFSHVISKACCGTPCFFFQIDIKETMHFSHYISTRTPILYILCFHKFDIHRV